MLNTHTKTFLKISKKSKKCKKCGKKVAQKSFINFQKKYF